MPKKRIAVAPAPSVRSHTIEARIHIIRGFRVLLDSDLAELYGVETKVLNQAVTRNAARFPADFAFQITAEELTNLISQSEISSLHGGRRNYPLPTWHAALMNSSRGTMARSLRCRGDEPESRLAQEVNGR
jgi:hypothetical protein